jgi:hypothetical protein
MDEMEKYLAAMEVAVETKNKKAIKLLEGLSAYVYQEAFARLEEASGEERAAWEGIHQRAKLLVAAMAKTGHDIWL